MTDVLVPKANLISNNRDYIDSIDVEDTVVEQGRGAGSISHSTSPMRPSLNHHATSPAGTQSRTSSLHCTLILFDDKLVIVKRVSAGINGRKVTGLDSIDKMMKAGGGLNGLALSGTTFTKDKLEFRGVVDILDVIATDVGNSGAYSTSLVAGREADPQVSFVLFAYQNSSCSSRNRLSIKGIGGPAVHSAIIRSYIPPCR